MTPKKLTKEQLAHLEEIRNSYQELRKPAPEGLSVILSDPEGVIASKEEREKRWAAEKLKAKKFRKKIRRYLYVALIIIGAILVILKT